MKKIAFLTLVALFLLTLPVRAQINLLHEFAGGANDGKKPYGSLILSGSTLYGMSHFGGGSDLGTIFKIQTDGSGFALLHEFAGGAADGGYPYGSLIFSGSTLYGMTEYGGASTYGTIFKMQTDGSGFALLHSFAAGTADGAEPCGSLIISGSILYGMTPYYGANTKGTIFKMQTDGSGYTLLHSFAGGAADGAFPFGSLVISGSALYGMTYYGGDSDYGTVFKMETDGSGFTLLHEFAGGTADGASPRGSLILSGSALYGMTYYGGDSDYGTVFKIETDGTSFTLLHEFAGGAADGYMPYTDLTISGSTLYGMTIYGGESERGTIFKVQTDGSGFSLLHEFAGGADDGKDPYGSLILFGLDLYGMTMLGGDNDQGVIFSLPVPSITSVDFLGTWDGQGVYYRNSITAAWVKMASPATLITAGDLGGDGVDDLIGIWPSQGGVWVKSSTNGAWTKLSTTAEHIASGDMNGDGRVDFLGTWDGQGVYYRNSLSGVWVKMASPATLITAGDLDSDGIDDLIGIWPTQGGVWVKYSKTGAWSKLSSTAKDIAAGDMNGDGRDDLLATWDGQGVYYRNSMNGAWVKMASPADQVTCGDLDADGKSDLIGNWPTQGGVWVKYSETGSWAKLSSSAGDIAAGKMRAGTGGSMPAQALFGPLGGYAQGPESLIQYQDISSEGPGGLHFAYQTEELLIPQEHESEMMRIPGPGELGFRWVEEKNLIPEESRESDANKEDRERNTK